MSEIVSSPETEDAASDATLTEQLPSVGQQLGLAREAKGLTVSDVAKALKLSLRQVEALEADNWMGLPCTTIVRGFVRNYARLLGLDAKPLMEGLDRLHMPDIPELQISVGTTVSVPQDGKVERRDLVRVFSGLSILFLAVLAYFFLPQELWHSTVSALKSATQSKATVVHKNSPLVDVPKAQETEVAPPAIIPLNNEPAPSETTSTIAASTAVSVPMNSSSSGNGLKLSFAQPSWVEVRDRSGEIIFSQLCPAGSQQEIEGQSPFALVIGNASHVTLRYKGKMVDLSKRSKDDVARVTVE